MTYTHTHTHERNIQQTRAFCVGIDTHTKKQRQSCVQDLKSCVREREHGKEMKGREREREREMR